MLVSPPAAQLAVPGRGAPAAAHHPAPPPPAPAGYLRLWSGGAASDPWSTATDSSKTLDELRAYWNANMQVGGRAGWLGTGAGDGCPPVQTLRRVCLCPSPMHALPAATPAAPLPRCPAAPLVLPPQAIPRTTVHMLSGQQSGGGVAYLGVLCDWYRSRSSNSGYGEAVCGTRGGMRIGPCGRGAWQEALATWEPAHRPGLWGPLTCAVLPTPATPQASPGPLTASSAGTATRCCTEAWRVGMVTAGGGSHGASSCPALRVPADPPPMPAPLPPGPQPRPSHLGCVCGAARDRGEHGVPVSAGGRDRGV